jgi:protein-S-isoprenylcysteine O-methyltransferase Ste14
MEGNAKTKAFSYKCHCRYGEFINCRHPMYLSFMIISWRVCISQHWLSLILGAILVFLIYEDMRSEEQLNFNQFGDEYRHICKKRRA